MRAPFDGLYFAVAVFAGGMIAVSGNAAALEPVEPPASFAGYFSQPIDCEAGQDCVIQQYVDIDPSRKWQDYRCGKASYNGHKGTDFRITNAVAYLRGVSVVAAAPGRVLRVRDDAADRQVKSAADQARVKGAECGNGLVVDHGGGMVSQYCHLRRGSLLVRPGARVARGAALGLVGLSGATQMPHVHISFRYKGKIVDPYLGLEGLADGGAPKCRTSADASSLWRADVLRDFPYSSSRVIEAGFAAKPIKLGAREAETAGGVVSALSPNLVLFARVINFRDGDRLEMAIEGPQGFRVSQSYGPLARHKARYLGLVGKRRRAARWPAGDYHGEVKVTRGGALHETRRVVVTID